MTDCECGHSTLFTRTGRVLCSHTASKAQELGIIHIRRRRGTVVDGEGKAGANGDIGMSGVNDDIRDKTKR